jgi:hypothetical protein
VLVLELPKTGAHVPRYSLTSNNLLLPVLQNRMVLVESTEVGRNRETDISSQWARYTAGQRITLLATPLKNLCIVSTPLFTMTHWFSASEAVMTRTTWLQMASLPTALVRCSKAVRTLILFVTRYKRSQAKETGISEIPGAFQLHRKSQSFVPGAIRNA